MTQKLKIFNYLKENPQWFKSYELQGMAQGFGASPATVDRRLRDLYKEGSVERRRVGRYEEYRLIQEKPVIDLGTFNNADEVVVAVQEALLSVEPIRGYTI